MTGVQLARRMGVAPPSVVGMERREVAGTISLSTLRKAADALQCDVVVALVPRKPLEVLVAERARAVATEKIDRISHTMELEQQGNAASFRERMIETEAARLMNQSSNELWSEPS
jgi:predicted DNA-binding mobile mystery protein A